MNQHKTCSELKDMAKGRMERNYAASIVVILSVAFIQYLTTELLTMLIPIDTTTQFILYRLILFFISSFLGVFELGVCLFFLNIACHQPARTDNIFYGYQNNSTSALLISFIKNALSTIALIPFLIFAKYYMTTNDKTYIIGMFISGIIGLLIYYPIQLAISQSYFLLLDFPEYTAFQALKNSCKLMKNNMLRLFFIQLSFLPLNILCIFTLGIGYLWLTPYKNMTYTLFFLDLMKTNTVSKA